MTDNPDETLPVEQKRAWPFNGYAPGNYSCRCGRCQCQFDGDKRAVQCLECAVIMAKSAAQSPPPVVSEEMLTDAVAWAINVEFTRLNASKIWQPLRQEEAEALAKAALRALSSPSRGCDAETVEACAKVADRMQKVAAERLQDEHDDDAAAQHDTAMEIAAAIRNLGKETREGEGE